MPSNILNSWMRFIFKAKIHPKTSDCMFFGTRGQTDTDNPAEYGFIRNRIVPLGLKRIKI